MGPMRWLARGEGRLPSGTDWLTESEQARAATMRYAKRHTEYLLRRYAAKSAVAAVTGRGTDPGDLARIAVCNAPTGAPYVLVDGEPLGMDVSLTDRAGWAVCLVGRDLAAVGCDLELVEPRSDGFVRDFLTPAEQRYVAAQRHGEAADEPAHAAADERAHAAANLLWSAKESALKVLRTGLRRDTRSVEVTIDGSPAGGPDGGDSGGRSHGEVDGGWRPLRVRCAEGPVFPGWWRRDGLFLLTVVAPERTPPPEALDDPGVLATATPRHSWLDQPLRSPEPR